MNIQEIMAQKPYKILTRQERGELLLSRIKIEKTPDGWKVSSSTGKGHYFVKFNGHEPECTCLDCKWKRQRCKHIYAVELYIRREMDREGNVSETKGVKITYSQDWKAYDKAQTNEKLMFMKLLRDLCTNIEQKTYKFGRPSLPDSDMFFASALKVYSTFSLRRFMSDIQIAKEMKVLENSPCYASIGHFMQREDITATLKGLIKISSSPLSEVESKFAVDSSGFAISRFDRWFDYKWGKERKSQMWLKAHVCVGVKTNIVTAVEVTDGTANDSPQLPRLVQECSERFDLSEVICDKAYASRENFNVIDKLGADPLIPFKSNAVAKPRRAGKMELWRKMYYYFMYKHEEFKARYHQRSNVETCFHMIKTKFKDNLRSKSSTAQVNELLLKILCHNICVVIQEISELGIRGEFVMEKTNEPTR